MKVGIVGTSGYSGGELLRILFSHPEAEIEYIASSSRAGTPLHQVFPQFEKVADLTFEPVDAKALGKRCDVVFTATPHGVAMDLALDILEGGTILIDIGSDFRFRDHRTFEEWYQVEHRCPELTARAVYGLPELFRAEIEKADLIANPGCYPTSAILALAPAVSLGLIDLNTIVISSISGVSGAGATPKPMYHLPHAVENVQSYGIPGHRHTPEIEQGLAQLLGEEVPPLSFSPHLAPMSRGILTHVNARLIKDVEQDQIIEAYSDFYQNAPFVRILADRLPQTKVVSGTNFCDIAPRLDKRTGRIIVESVVDNLVKGASGQAVQNMNLRFQLEETMGLEASALHP